MTDKTQAQNLARFLRECEAGEEEFDRVYCEGMTDVSECVGKILALIEAAETEIYYRNDALRQSMSVEAFRDMILTEVKDEL